MRKFAWLLLGYVLLTLSPGPRVAAGSTALATTPTGFEGSAVATDTIQWTWNDNLGETFYLLHTHPDDGFVASIPQNQTFHVEDGLAENTQYVRHLHAFESGELSPPTSPFARYTLVHNPTAAEFTLELIAPNSVRVTVQPPPNNGLDLTGIEIRRGEMTLQDFSATTTITETNVPDGQTLRYFIRFRNGDGVETALSPANEIAIPPLNQATATVSIGGPFCVHVGKASPFTASGEPTGGTYEWTPVKGAALIAPLDGANTATTTATGIAEGEVTLEVKYSPADGTKPATQQHSFMVVKELKLPVQAHLIREADGTGGTERTAAEVTAMFAEANRILEQACVHLELKGIKDSPVPDILARTPLKVGLEQGNSADLTELRAAAGHEKGTIDCYFVRKMTVAIGVTRGSGQGSFVTIRERKGDAVTLAHEFGHVGGLPNLAGDNKSNLMYSPNDGGTALTYDQIKQIISLYRSTIDALKTE